MERARSIQGLGEIALRVEDLAGMTAFYETVVGLKLLRQFPNAAFFQIADGFAGHTQVLALFDRTSEADYRGLSRQQTTMDHFAFEIALDDYAAEKARLEGLGIAIETAEHAWVHWRSLYFLDPEGNQVEFVCYDPTVKD
jgi:catechol 2,3-dioxygenase-like lactoylglutathione lyase family enzyme